MKTKLLMTVMTLLMANAAYANIVCQSAENLPYTEIEIKAGNFYTVSVVGMRVKHEAEYKLAHRSSSGNTKSFVLVKVDDSSSFKDMPPQLILKSQLSISPQNSYQLVGLGNSIINFWPQTCTRVGN